MANLLNRLILAAMLPMAMLHAQEEESSSLDTKILKPSDVILITLKEDEKFVFEGPVDASGNVELPYVGKFKVAKLTPLQIEEKLQPMLLEQFYKRATVNVSIITQSPGVIYIYGAVENPGAVGLPVTNEMTVLQAIASAGNLTAWADPSAAYIVTRSPDGSETRIDIDLGEQLRLSGTQQGAMTMSDGQELYIPGRDPKDTQLLTSEPREVIVVGQVGTPGIIKIARGEQCTLMRAIFKAGGLGKFADADEDVTLIRYRGEDRTTKKINLDRIINKGFLHEDIDLEAGDMIIVGTEWFRL